ncbi:MAG: hypothetical protein E7623_02655 [Ruminococcaceae bacterium]|nr:hypothetical protein [Oscillospiraceae bacterium]
MKKIFISDMTIRQSSAEEGNTLSFREKIELAEMLDKLGVSIIELGTVGNKKTDSLLIKSIASSVKHSTVAVSVTNPENTEFVWSALRSAVSPRLQVEAPVSSVGMEYSAKKKPAALIEYIKENVSVCKSLCSDVEFIAKDATRAETEFLKAAISAAVSAGATTVTLCDTAGAMLPEEFSEFITDITNATPELSEVRLGVDCSNAMYTADACAVSSVRHGVGEIKAYVCGGNGVSLKNIARIINSKGCELDASCDIRHTSADTLISHAERLCAHESAKRSVFGAAKEQTDDGIRLTENDSISDIAKAAQELGYELSEEDKIKVHEEFIKVVSKKKSVSSKELDAIVAAHAMQVPPTYKLESYIINAGNIISATAHIKMTKNGSALEGISAGDGPIDAAFRALEQITGHHYELDDFQIQSITEGREALGQTVVKLRSGGKVYSGRGTSTDIIGASISAYVNALNKIVFEEV